MHAGILAETLAVSWRFPGFIVKCAPRQRQGIDPAPVSSILARGGIDMIYRFADCELDTMRFELRRGGTAQKIEPQVFEILRFLVERPGQFVGKEELHKAIWQNRVVSDAAVSSRIKAARYAIGDDGTVQRLIRTVHGRGFSFVAPVVALEDHAASDDSMQSAAGGQAPGALADATGSRVAGVLSADFHPLELLNGDASAAAAEAKLLSRRATLRAKIEEAGGRIVRTGGGGITARFDNAADAVACAASLQTRSSQATLPASADASLRPRIGVCELGEELEKAAALAERLQCLATPGEIWVTGRVEESARGKYGFASKPAESGPACDLGELGLSITIIQASEPLSASERPGIPQLQCGSPVQPREPSIVILPFQALGSDERTLELAEGLRIDIQNGLVKISRLLLVAAASANAFRGKSPEAAARSLGVRYVLHGMVQMVGERARISLELADSTATQAAWAEQFDVWMTDAFAIQDDITRKVITALDVKLYSGEQARIWHQVLTDPEVLRVFYHGVRLFFRMEREAMAEARRSFESVARMRPESSIGATWAALCHWIDCIRRWSDSRTESQKLAKRWAEAAAELPDADGQAHTVLAHVRLLDREFDAALEAGRRALEIRPGCANANGFFGNVLHYCGEQGEAITHLRRGIRRQPVYPPFFAGVLAAAYFAAGQTESGGAVAKEALRLNPGDLQSRLVLLAASQASGNHQLARIFAGEILRLDAAFSIRAYRDNQPYRDQATIGGMAGAWLAAGLPA